MIYCEGRTPEQYQGYEIDLFRLTASRVGLPDLSLQWSCLTFTDAVAGINNGTCDVLLGMNQSNDEEYAK